MPTWRIEIKPTAERQYLRLDRPTRKRLKKALAQLEDDQSPLFHPRVRPLAGKLKGDYRLRVGGWRVLFTPDWEEHVLHVYALIPRGDAY